MRAARVLPGSRAAVIRRIAKSDAQFWAAVREGEERMREAWRALAVWSW